MLSQVFGTLEVNDPKARRYQHRCAPKGNDYGTHLPESNYLVRKGTS
jgi:hypothetical protein